MARTGSGKTGSAILIAEQFKEQVKKYNTKIFVVVPGPNTRDNFKNEILTWTGETYLKNKGTFNQMTKMEKEREIKIALYAAAQYYKIMSYKTFYKKVLGEKIVEKKLSSDNKIKTNYKKTTEGDYERELVVDRITNMDNALLIIDEAHNITSSQSDVIDDYNAFKRLTEIAVRSKFIFITATPMVNSPKELILLMNLSASTKCL
jgi:superfamily II DNA or RNA helicase